MESNISFQNPPTTGSKAPSRLRALPVRPALRLAGLPPITQPIARHVGLKPSVNITGGISCAGALRSQEPRARVERELVVGRDQVEHRVRRLSTETHGSSELDVEGTRLPIRNQVSIDSLNSVRQGKEERKNDLHVGSTAAGISSLVRVLLVLHLARLVGNEREDARHLHGGPDAVLGHGVDQIRRGVRGGCALVAAAAAGRRARHDSLDDADGRRSPFIEGSTWGQVGASGGKGQACAGEGEGSGESR